ncbi:hypothetical protein PAE9249_02291 [Paenibacillus sp. CECT 9249]|nr:hypothetical protein PAE9249_02291 [Paenibacillus sp. CECT 9249]
MFRCIGDIPAFQTLFNLVLFLCGKVSSRERCGFRMKLSLKEYNTLRNQILVVFLSVMIIVLLIVGIMTFHLVSALITKNAEKQIRQTAAEANGRLETLYKQIDVLTSQMVTNTEVQQLLLQVAEGHPAKFEQRQALTRTIGSFQVYSDGINSLDLYTKDYQRLYPLDETNLLTRLDKKWVEEADRAKGSMVWIGTDPRDPAYFLAIRRISLIDRWFSNGGYLLIRMNRNYFQLEVPNSSPSSGEYMVLVDRNMATISSNYDGDIGQAVRERLRLTIQDKEYIVVRQSSDLTGWTLYILTPVGSLTEGLSVLRTAIAASGGIGFFIFLVFSVFLSTLITRPVLKLIKTMRSARTGTLKPSPEMNSTVEINELTKTYNQMVDNMNELIEAIYEKELVRSHTELKALQAQIDPHFLYNTLEALYWSLQDKEEDELAELVIAMSDLFRYTIGNAHQGEWVTIRDELEHAERYMQLMKLRFGDRLTWSISAAPGCERVPIPKLMIQPLVENAVLHGVGNKKGPGSVHIRVRRADPSPKWIIEVEDDGPGIEESAVRSILRSLEQEAVVAMKGSGMAIANVNKRLRLYYDRAKIRDISIRSQAGQGTVITFEIPGGDA